MRTSLVAIPLVAILSASAAAQLPGLLVFTPFQFLLEDQFGQKITGPQSVVVRLYATPTGGNPLFTETHTLNVVNGVANLQVGSQQPLLSTLFDLNPMVYAGLQIGNDQEMIPRALLPNAAYAAHARQANIAGDVPGMDITPNSVSVGNNARIASDGVAHVASMVVRGGVVVDVNRNVIANSLIVGNNTVVDSNTNVNAANVNATTITDGMATLSGGDLNAGKITVVDLLTTNLNVQTISVGELTTTADLVVTDTFTGGEFAQRRGTMVVPIISKSGDFMGTSYAVGNATVINSQRDADVNTVAINNQNVIDQVRNFYANSYRVNNQLVIDSGGNWLGQPIDTGQWTMTTNQVVLKDPSKEVALNNTDGAIFASVDGTNSTKYCAKWIATNAGPTVVIARHLATTGSTNQAMVGEIQSQQGTAIYGHAASSNSTTSQFAVGVLGQARAKDSVGVQGQNDAIGGTSMAGIALSLGGRGSQWYGHERGSLSVATGDGGSATYLGGWGTYQPTNLNERGSGLYGSSTSNRGVGVRGFAQGTSATKTSDLTGVMGQTTSTNGYAGFWFGDMGATGTKMFIHPHPRDPARSVGFVCLEGNEAGTYFRGRAKLVDNVCEIEIPEAWQLVSADQGVTVQVTPVDAPSRLWVPVQTRDRIVVRGDVDCTFSYVVNGVRDGYEKHDPFVPNTAYRPRVKGVPFATQYPKRIRDLLVQARVLNPDYTPNEVTAAKLGWELIEPAAVPPIDRWWLPPADRQRLLRESMPKSVGLPVPLRRSESSAHRGGRRR